MESDTKGRKTCIIGFFKPITPHMCSVCSKSLTHYSTLVSTFFQLYIHTSPKVRTRQNALIPKLKLRIVITGIIVRFRISCLGGFWVVEEYVFFCFSVHHVHWLDAILPQGIMCPMTMASSTSSVMWPTKARSGEPARHSSFVPTAPQRTNCWLSRMNATQTS